MFLRILNDDQKRVLVIIAHHLVISDQSISKKEGDILDELLNGLRTEVRVTPQQLYAKPSLAVFDSREVRIAVMLEILTLACGDNMFPDPESKMVEKLSRDLGFSNAEFEDMKQWGEKNSLLLNEALTMMEAS